MMYVCVLYSIVVCMCVCVLCSVVAVGYVCATTLLHTTYIPYIHNALLLIYVVVAYMCYMCVFMCAIRMYVVACYIGVSRVT